MSLLLPQHAARSGQSAKAQAIALRRTRHSQTLYLSSGARAFPIILYASAAINLIFWGNLATWVFADYVVKRPAPVIEASSAADETDDKNIAAESFELAPLRTRVAYAAGLASLGVAISTGFLLVSKRVVRRIDLQPGGTHVRLYTGFGTARTAMPLIQPTGNKSAAPLLQEQQPAGGHLIALTDLSMRKSVFTGAGNNQALSESGSYTQLLRRGQLIGYLLDRRGTFLGGPQVFDALVVTQAKTR